MFSKALVVQYKLYSRNLIQLKNKLATAVNKNPLHDSLEKLGKYSSTLSVKLDEVKRIDTSEHRLGATQSLKKYIINNVQKCHYQKVFFGSTGIAAASVNNDSADAIVQTDLTSGTINVGEITDSVSSATLELPKDDLTVELIPEPPPVPELDFIDTVAQLNALGEPTLASMELGGWTPVGLIQTALEQIHVMGVPWWGAIAIGTVIVRFLMFPLVIISQRNAAKMNNYLPQLQAIQLKMTEARQSGNQLEAARYSQELMIFMKEKGLNPLKNMVVPLAQMPLFISFFMGLRQMANLPVDSLRQGGLFWFTDLTLPDEFFILPVITSLTLWITIEIGTDSARLSAQNLQVMKYVLRAMPVMILPLTINFPGAILCYWVSSNFISLAQVGVLKIPKVRDYFNIEPLITHNPKNLPMPSKGFVGGVKDSWTNIKITKQLEERKRYDEMQFQRAGRGPIVKTFKYDPTKQTKNTVAAKPR